MRGNIKNLLSDSDSLVLFCLFYSESRSQVCAPEQVVVAAAAGVAGAASVRRMRMLRRKSGAEEER